MSSVSLALVILKNDVKLGLTEVFELKGGGCYKKYDLIGYLHNELNKTHNSWTDICCKVSDRIDIYTSLGTQRCQGY